MNLNNLSATGTPPQAYIYSDPGAIPTKWQPMNPTIDNVPTWRMLGVDAGNMVEATGNLSISLDGKINISKNLNNMFNPGGNPCGFYNFSAGWAIKKI
jgi:hypothetical protein